MSLNPWETQKTYFTTNGNVSFIRDTPKPIIASPVVEEKTEEPEPEIEVVMGEEPTLEILAEEIPATKNTKKKK
jgi:hypothetical protein